MPEKIIEEFFSLFPEYKGNEIKNFDTTLSGNWYDYNFTFEINGESWSGTYQSTKTLFSKEK